MSRYIIHDVNNDIITDKELEKFNFFEDAQKAATDNGLAYPHYSIRECNEIIPDNTKFPGYHYGPKFFAIIDISLYQTTEPKTARKTKDSYIRFRCTEEEEQAIKLEAEKHHLSVSAYILSKLLG